MILLIFFTCSIYFMFISLFFLFPADLLAPIKLFIPVVKTDVSTLSCLLSDTLLLATRMFNSFLVYSVWWLETLQILPPALCTRVHQLFF